MSEADVIASWVEALDLEDPDCRAQFAAMGLVSRIENGKLGLLPIRSLVIRTPRMAVTSVDQKRGTVTMESEREDEE